MGEDIGLGPDSAAYLRRELNAEPLSEATRRLVEDLVRFLRREGVEVRLYLGYEPVGAQHVETQHAASLRPFLHYYLESYKEEQQKQDEFELGRQEALVGIFKSRFLKRLESSIDAFRISIRRAISRSSPTSGTRCAISPGHRTTN